MERILSYHHGNDFSRTSTQASHIWLLKGYRFRRCGSNRLQRLKFASSRRASPGQ